MIRVNGELIDPRLVEDTFSRIKAEAETRLQISCCERDEEFMQQAEEEVIDSILIAQEAETRHPTVPEDAVRRRLEDLIKQYRDHGASWDMLEAQREQLREECEANLRMDALIDELLEGADTPGEDELRRYYETHRGEYRTPAEVRCLHLIKFLARHDDPLVLLDTMRSLRETTLDGTDFEELAARETEKENGVTDLGWIPLDRPANSFESILFTMRDGEISPVIFYEEAYHLIKVTGLKPSVTPSFDELRDELLPRCQIEQRRVALRNLAAQLRKDARIEAFNPNDDGNA